MGTLYNCNLVEWDPVDTLFDQDGASSMIRINCPHALQAAILNGPSQREMVKINFAIFQLQFPVLGVNN